jgi:putative restriction endonuclease
MRMARWRHPVYVDLTVSIEPVNQYQRAFLAWPFLTATASNHATITYKELGDRLAIHHRPVRFVLGVIQDHCLIEKLPPLTIVVVSRGRDTPGEGFIAWDVDDLGEGYKRVYSYPWHTIPNPFVFASDGKTTEQWAEELLRRPDKSVEVYLQVRNRGIAQDIFRLALLKAYGHRCAFCGLSIKPALEAAHIVPWTAASQEERMAPSNGLLLCATHHALFDAHMLTVNPACKITCTESPSAPHWSEADRRTALAMHGQSVTLPGDSRFHPSPRMLQRRAEMRG